MSGASCSNQQSCTARKCSSSSLVVSTRGGFADANLDHAAQHVARGAFLSTGQKCTATSRVIVDQAVFEDFAARLARLASSWPVGDPLDHRQGWPAVERGAVRDRHRLSRHSPPRRGDGPDRRPGRQARWRDFVPPILRTGLPRDSCVVPRDLGPVAALLPVDSYDEAVALANDTPFGLSAGVFTTDLASALRFARDIRAGIVKINDETAVLNSRCPSGA